MTRESVSYTHLDVYKRQDQITLEQLFDHLFRIIDPTSLNCQGNDVGTSYRTGIYPACAEDEAIARQFVAERQKDYDLSLIHILTLNDGETIGFSAEEKLPITCGPVSYTHLDVYKRQRSALTPVTVLVSLS